MSGEGIDAWKKMAVIVKGMMVVICGWMDRDVSCSDA